jgi:hypothetical protein
LWDTRSSHNPTVSAATTQRSRSPAPTSRKKNNRRNGNSHSKSCTHFPALISFLFKILAMARASSTI